MALTITPDLTTIHDAEAVDTWASATAISLNDVFFWQGAGCLAQKVSEALGGLATYPLTASIDLSGGEHIFQWFMVTGAASTKATGGYRIYLESTTGNNATWYVAGYDTVTSNWICVVLDPNSTPDESNGTLDLTNINTYGVQFNITSRASGNNPNVFWDISRFGFGYTVTSLDTDDISINDIYLVDDANTTKYGMLSKVNDVFFGKGQIILNNTTGGDLVTTIANEVIVFATDSVDADFFMLKSGGSSTYTTNIDITGSVLKSAGEKTAVDFGNAESVITIDGTQLANCNDVSFNTNASVTNSVLDACNQITTNNCTFTNNTIVNTTEATTGALNIADATSITECTSLIFNSYTGKYAVYIPAAVTGTVSFDNWVFDGSGTDVYWAGTSGTLTVNKVNGSNPSTYSSGGGIVEFLSSITINIHVADEDGADVATAYVYVDEDHAEPYIINTTSDVNGDASGSYSGASTSCTVRIRKYGYKPYVGTASLTSDINLNVTLITDPQQT